MKNRLMILPMIAMMLFCACGSTDVQTDPFENMTFIEEVKTMPGGEKLSTYKSIGRVNYMLDNGVTLAYYYEGTVDELVINGKSDDIIDFMQELEPVIDVDSYIDIVYADYATYENKQEFYDTIMLRDETSLSLETENYIMLIRVIGAPIEGTNGDMATTQYPYVFNKNTGENVPVWELFSVPEDEVIDHLANLMKDANYSYDLLVESITADNILLFDNNCDISFPIGAIGNDTMISWGFDYSQLGDILIPEITG